tara:strand:- start:14104 stop:14238 length:135 start_codon:yes stop_codon:yes gene_type:complete
METKANIRAMPPIIIMEYFVFLEISQPFVVLDKDIHFSKNYRGW